MNCNSAKLVLEKNVFFLDLTCFSFIYINFCSLVSQFKSLRANGDVRTAVSQRRNFAANALRKSALENKPNSSPWPKF